jgi:hypothetical protein
MTALLKATYLEQMLQNHGMAQNEIACLCTRGEQKPTRIFCLLSSV